MRVGPCFPAFLWFFCFLLVSGALEVLHPLDLRFPRLGPAFWVGVVVGLEVEPCWRG